MPIRLRANHVYVSVLQGMRVSTRSLSQEVHVYAWKSVPTKTFLTHTHYPSPSPPHPHTHMLPLTITGRRAQPPASATHDEPHPSHAVEHAPRGPDLARVQRPPVQAAGGQPTAALDHAAGKCSANEILHGRPCCPVLWMLRFLPFFEVSRSNWI